MSLVLRRSLQSLIKHPKSLEILLESVPLVFIFPQNVIPESFHLFIIVTAGGGITVSLIFFIRGTKFMLLFDLLWKNTRVFFVVKEIGRDW